MSEELQPSMTADQLVEGWTPQRIGRRIIVLAEVASTNTAALEAAHEPDADGLAVLADYQTAGRGRQGREWLSPRAASILCSVLLLTDDTESSRGQTGGEGRLTLISAVASCEAIRGATNITPNIKWPNDLRISGKKVGGILIESRTVGQNKKAWVIGVGINCLQHEGHFPPELCETATSLEIAATHPIDRVEVARELLRSLDKWLAEIPDDETIHNTWLSFAEPIGQRVRLSRGRIEHVGRTVDVDPAGGLIVQLDDGRREWFDPMITTLL
ncbi:MAG: biotin--[acetyl-CoA-carboxylase] ligase [Planctomycetota bacterium]|jgi:BirA family biotin operon repressor/biotin-[acetyl-CoA-carboxylase] ligase